LDELGISTSTRSNIKFLMVGNGSQFGFISSITANTTVFDRKLINDQNSFTAACSRSTALEHLPNANTDKGIAYFHTALNRWEPMPRLINPGADRCAAVAIPPVIVESLPMPDLAALAVIPSLVDEAAAIEIEELIDRALEMLYGSPGKQFSLTKLFANKSQRARLATVLIDTLQVATGIDYKPQKNGAVTCHYFTASQPDND
jgi:hypothetical protein